MKVPRCNCPHCGESLSGASPSALTDVYYPAPGDISVCIYCGTKLVFDAAILVRRMTEEEWQAVSEEARQAVEYVIANREELAKHYPPAVR